MAGHRSKHLCLVLLLLLASLGMPPLPAAGAVLQQRIALDFELDRHLMYASAELRIPADTAALIDCGPLALTGLVLERKGRGVAALRPDAANRLHIPAAEEEQVLTYSWQLTTPAQGADDNLISPDGLVLAGFWHPVADRDLHAVLDVHLPSRFEAVSEAGAMVSRRTGTGKQVTFTPTQPLRVLHLAAGPYAVRTKRLGDLTLSTYLFPEDAALADDYLAGMTELVERFQQRLGPFPYPRFALVENRLATGYGLPGFTLIGQSIIRLPFVRERSLGHEMLHSWFGNSVGISDQGGNWSEGLTSYLADQDFAAEAGRGGEFRKAQLVRYLDYVHPDRAIPLEQFSQAGDNKPLDRAIRAVGYEKGALVFHMLRRRIGESAFFAGLKDFLRTMQGRRAGWGDLEAAFSRHTGQDLGPFFRQWLTRRDIPEIGIERVRIDQQQGRVQLHFDLIQKTGEPYQLDIPVRVTAIGRETRAVLSTDQLRTPFTLQLDSLPSSLIVDERYDLLRRLEDPERPPTWSRFLGAEKQTVLIPAPSEAARHQPLIEGLRRAGCSLRTEAEVTNSELGQGSWVLVGDSAQRRSLFAQPPKPGEGFQLEVRRSPLNPQEVMVLADSASEPECRLAAAKLDHYGPYSRLRFLQGRNRDKTLAPSSEGMVLPLMDKPQGVPVRAVQDFDRIVDELARQQVVYLGETHTEYGDHLLQLQVIQALQARNKRLVIGLEMFPAASQPALDDFIARKIDERRFVDRSRYFSVWGYDYRLYRDIFQFARTHRIPLVGLNLEKGITSRVFSDGSTDGLTPEQQAQIPKERDLDLPGYRQRLEGVLGRHDAPHGKGMSGFVQAQALWDETMAENAVKTMARHPDCLLVVLAGNGHVTRDSGIPPRVERRLPGKAQRVLAVLRQGEEQETLADYLMLAPSVELAPAGKLGVVLKEQGEKTGPGRLVIESISPHGLAGKAGLEQEDRILAIDDQPVTSVVDTRMSLLDKKAGDKVQVKIVRGRRELTVPVELSSPEVGMAAPPGHPKP